MISLFRVHHGPEVHCPVRLSLFVFWCHPQEAPLSRGKRTVEESKTCCLLHFHADHLYYQRFKSVKAVVAQVTTRLTSLKRVHVITSGLLFSVPKSTVPNSPTFHRPTATAPQSSGQRSAQTVPCTACRLSSRFQWKCPLIQAQFENNIGQPRLANISVV